MRFIQKLARPELKVESYTDIDNRYLKEGEYVNYILDIYNIGGTVAQGIDVYNNISDYLEIYGGIYWNKRWKYS